MHTFNFNGFESWRDSFRFKSDTVHTFAGISGGRTSAVVAACSDPFVRLLFENTGREDEKTYVFIRELDRAVRRQRRDILKARGCEFADLALTSDRFGITWLEYRPPVSLGDWPQKAEYAVVNFESANRTGQPFKDFMRALYAFRQKHGAHGRHGPAASCTSCQTGTACTLHGPVSPWKKSRICTAQMKHKTAERFIERSLGLDEYTMFVGLRADEPGRVSDLKVQETAKQTFRCPLFDLGISKVDVLRFWSQQTFDLDLPAYRGNCDGCWLKKQADLARIMHEIPDPEFWFEMEEMYPKFGGVGFGGYRRLAAEYDVRLKIENRLRAGQDTADLEAQFPKRRRYLSVLKQEQYRLDNPEEGVSCSCEASTNLPEEGV